MFKFILKIFFPEPYGQFHHHVLKYTVCLADLYLFLWDDQARKEFFAAADNTAALSERDFRLLNVYRSYYEQVFSGFDDRTRQGVLATVAQVLSPFQHPDLADYFCSDRADAANLEDVLHGRVFLVDLPLALWGVGAKVVYTLIKLRFFNVMQQRQNRPELNQITPGIFIIKISLLRFGDFFLF